MRKRLVLAAVLTAALTSRAYVSAQTINALTIMTFNVWVAEGTQTGRNKLQEIILSSGPTSLAYRNSRTAPADRSPPP